MLRNFGKFSSAFLCVEHRMSAYSGAGISNILKSIPLSSSFDVKSKTKHSIRDPHRHTHTPASRREIVFVLLLPLCAARCQSAARLQRLCSFLSHAINELCVANTRSRSFALPLVASSSFFFFICFLPVSPVFVDDFCLVKFLPRCHTENRQRVIRLASFGCHATHRNFPSSLMSNWRLAASEKACVTSAFSTHFFAPIPFARPAHHPREVVSTETGVDCKCFASQRHSYSPHK